MEHYGTKLLYIFNTYIVRKQKEKALLESDNIFAFVVLASLYMIKAGNDTEKRLYYKKKLVEIALEKQYSAQKLFRLLTFVKYLVTLPPTFEIKFKNFSDSKIKQKMIDEKKRKNDQLTESLEFFFPEVAEKYKEKGIEKGIEKESERLILHFYRQLGFTVAQIVTATDYPIEFVQMVIDKNNQDCL